MRHTALIILLFISDVLFAQNNVGINTNTPEPSAALHIESSDQGLLVPRLTVAQRDAITAPATGLIIYNADDNQEEIYNGTCWIPSYLQTCDDCLVTFDVAQSSYTIDRINTLSVGIPIDIQQTTSNGTAAPMNLGLLHTFSNETEVTLSQYTLNGSGTVALTITTNVFEPGGTYYVTLFTSCGNRSYAETIEIVINPCIEVDISSDTQNYNLAANGIDGSSCVVVRIHESIGVRSATSTQPAFSTGTINPNCNLGILVDGYVFGKGGDGPQFMGQNGADGGTAIETVCKTVIRNSGMIYGGGGSGLTVGAFQSIDLGPFQLCFAIGAGGGGGMPNGNGGGGSQGNCTLVVGFWENGNSGGTYYDDNEGSAVSKNFSQSFSLGPVQGNIAITANSGGGGDFGEPGTSSSQPVSFSGTSLEICVNIPFVGDVCIPIPGFDSALNQLANTINNAFNNSAPGGPGYALKHNGAPVNVENGNYQTFEIRGIVGN